jgi:hypothetical protein
MPLKIQLKEIEIFSILFPEKLPIILYRKIYRRAKLCAACKDVEMCEKYR